MIWKVGFKREKTGYEYTYYTNDYGKARKLYHHYIFKYYEDFVAEYIFQYGYDDSKQAEWESFLEDPEYYYNRFEGRVGEYLGYEDYEVDNLKIYTIFLEEIDVGKVPVIYDGVDGSEDLKTLFS